MHILSGTSPPLHNGSMDALPVCMTMIMLNQAPLAIILLTMQGAAAGKSTGGGKVTPVQQLLAVYEAALTHLQAQGALLNSVKPEYLLPEADFTKLMEDRTAAAAGNPEEEERLDYWAAVEASFGAYSAMAWNCVLLQVCEVQHACVHANGSEARHVEICIRACKPIVVERLSAP